MQVLRCVLRRWYCVSCVMLGAAHKFDNAAAGLVCVAVLAVRSDY